MNVRSFAFAKLNGIHKQTCDQSVEISRYGTVVGSLNYDFLV